MVRLVVLNRGRKSLVILLLSLVGVGMMNGCGKQRISSEATITSVPSPPGLYARVAWIDNWLVVEYEGSITEADAYSARLWRLEPDGSHMEILALPDHPGCERQGFEAPTRLPDGRLSYIVRCKMPGKYEWSLHMMAYDLHTGRAERLLEYPLPSPQIGTGGFSWHPLMSRGITSDGRGRGLEEQLYWFTPEEAKPLNLGFPQAFSGVWAPDGKRIAFLAAPEQGRTGVARAESVFNLYLMEPDGTNVRPLIEGFRSPSSLAWSPDSRWLVFSADFGSFLEENGLWLVELATGKRRQIARERLSTPVWSPDGRRLVAIRRTGEHPAAKEELVIVEVGQLLAAP